MVGSDLATNPIPLLTGDIAAGSRALGEPDRVGAPSVARLRRIAGGGVAQAPNKHLHGDSVLQPERVEFTIVLRLPC